MKSWNIKSEEVMDKLRWLYPYLWNQYTLPLKSYLKSHSKYTAAKKVKYTVKLWMLVEETCNSTSLINLVLQRVMKVDLSLKNVYGENKELSEYFDIFMAQAKVAWEISVNNRAMQLLVLLKENFGRRMIPSQRRQHIVIFW